ncbi:MAG TPA: tyrosine-type recombinase/integrase [Burkholderiales bacterium]|jgi:integrase|nr:tyrosine-type recombinase/integrase [Burkholderiales bacterium]
MSELLLDRAGRRRSPAALPGFHAGHAPGNKGLRYPADPAKIEEIIAVMRTAGDGPHGRRLRELIVIMRRAGLRIQEALALAESDLDQRRGSLLVRRGKGRRRREVGNRRLGVGTPSALARHPARAPGRFAAPSRFRRSADAGRLNEPLLAGAELVQGLVGVADGLGIVAEEHAGHLPPAGTERRGLHG